ncbi:unnamed protein product [Aspergillus oryzae var. brunneus]|uniref:Unnamed protein product n=1 Tax=Aspergillus oryzae var. brunneus TaxID=332754 RepID=A0ABQ6LA47_ASPOZ|nr:unnamed protein product [Aspergillus oryzae]GMG52065.1 unnamed protein product [Aspergillus oryzae var. brunneus]
MLRYQTIRFGASPDSSMTTPPSSDAANWSLSLDNSLPSDETLDPTVINAVGMQPSYLLLVSYFEAPSCPNNELPTSDARST